MSEAKCSDNQTLENQGCMYSMWLPCHNDGNAPIGMKTTKCQSLVLPLLWVHNYLTSCVPVQSQHYSDKWTSPDKRTTR